MKQESKNNVEQGASQEKTKIMSVWPPHQEARPKTTQN